MEGNMDAKTEGIRVEIQNSVERIKWLNRKLRQWKRK